MRAKGDGDPNLCVLQTEPTAVRYVLAPSAFSLENDSLDNRNSVFLSNSNNRQLTDAFEYERDIRDVLISLSRRSRFLASWDYGIEFRLGACSVCLLSVLCVFR